MQISIKDQVIFGKLELTIKAENIEEIIGLIYTFNAPTYERAIARPTILKNILTDEEATKAVHTVEMPLWGSINKLLITIKQIAKIKYNYQEPEDDRPN